MDYLVKGCGDPDVCDTNDSCKHRVTLWCRSAWKAIWSRVHGRSSWSISLKRTAGVLLGCKWRRTLFITLRITSSRSTWRITLFFVTLWIPSSRSTWGRKLFFWIPSSRSTWRKTLFFVTLWIPTFTRCSTRRMNIARSSGCLRCLRSRMLMTLWCSRVCRSGSIINAVRRLGNLDGNLGNVP